MIIHCSVIIIYLNTELCGGHHDIVGADTLLKNIARPALHFTQCNIKYQFLHCVLLRKINSAMVTRLNNTFVSTLVSALLSALVTDLNFILVTRPTDAQNDQQPFLLLLFDASCTTFKNASIIIFLCGLGVGCE